MVSKVQRVTESTCAQLATDYDCQAVYGSSLSWNLSGRQNEKLPAAKKKQKKQNYKS